MSDVNKKAKRGLAILLGRQVVLQVATFAGGIVLARVLGPANFGLYVMSSFVVSLFAIVGDFGLAPALIQRKEHLSFHDIQVGFTLQQLATIAIVAVGLLLASPIARLLYPGVPAVVWLVRALLVNLYLTSWKTIGILQLERELRFDKLAKIEVAEILIYQSLAVGLALGGFGTWSYAIAALAQGSVGTGLIYVVAPWPVRIKVDIKRMVELLRFGIPFQFQMVTNSIGGWVTPLIVGRFIGPIGVGYLSWAASNGRKPLMVIDSVMRVAFPQFARIQDDLDEVERVASRYLAATLIVSGFWCVGLIVNGYAFVEWIYQPKWLPGVPALVIYSLIVPFDMVCGILTVALNGIGRVGLATRIMATRSTLGIIFSLTLIWLMRRQDQAYVAVPFGYLAASALSVPWIVEGIQPGAIIRVFRSVAWIAVPIFGGLTCGWATQAITCTLPLQWRVIVTGFGLTFGYVACGVASAPDWLRMIVRNTISNYVSRRRDMSRIAQVDIPE